MPTAPLIAASAAAPFAFLASSLRAISSRTAARLRSRAASRPSVPSSSALTPIAKTTRHRRALFRV